MLNTAAKYKFINVAGHNITGAISRKDAALRWENVSWMNEMAAECAALVGPSFRAVTPVDHLRATDVQRVIDWTHDYDSRNEINDGTRFFTSWGPDTNVWTKIADYSSSESRNVVSTAERESMSARWTAIHNAKRRFGFDFTVRAGDPVRIAPIRSLLNAFPNGFNVSVYNTLTLSGSMSGTDLDGHAFTAPLIPAGSVAWYDRTVSQHAYRRSTQYMSGSVVDDVRSDSNPVGNITISGAIGRPTYASNLRYFGEMIAVAWTRVSGLAWAYYSASTYRHDIIDQGSGVTIADMDWTSLKGLSAPAVSTTADCIVDRGVYLVGLIGVANLTLNASIYI